MEARVGHMPSYVWRSLLVGRDSLTKYLIWRNGNGRRVKIWKDPWISKPLSNKTQSSIFRLGEEETIDKLINEEGHS